MLKLKSLMVIGLLSSAVVLTACGKKEAETTQPQDTQDVVASGADMEVSSTPAIETPPEQIDAAP